MKLDRLVTAVLVILFWAVSPVPADAVSTEDFRVLSTIQVDRGCWHFDSSNDGKTLYVLCQGPDFSNGELYNYDVADLKHPVEISSTKLGKIGAWQLTVRGDRGFLISSPAYDKGTTILDLRNPRRIRIAGNIGLTGPWGARASDDGHTLVLRYSNNDGHTFDYTYVDASDPDHPKTPDMLEQPRPAWLNVPGPWLPAWLSDNVRGIGKVTLEDQRGSRFLAAVDDEGPMLKVYNVSGDGTPQVIASLALPEGVSSVRMLGSRRALVAAVYRRQGLFLELISTRPVAFDVERLKTAYQSVALEYATFLQGNSGIGKCEVRPPGISRMTDAGIHRLLNEQPSGLSSDERAKMLDDFGFLLGCGADQSMAELTRATIYLRKALVVAPNRPDVWLRLGDVLRRMMPLAMTTAQKSMLWSEAGFDFGRYHDLSGKDAPQAEQVASFDLSAVAKNAKNVCDYVAVAFNHGREGDISSPTGIATAGGLPVHFHVGMTGGAICRWPMVRSGDYDQTFNPSPDSPSPLGSFRFANDVPSEGGGAGMGGPDRIFIIPFRGKYYTVSTYGHGPYEVVDPNDGTVCTFSRRYEPKLVTDEEPGLCSRYLAGELRHNTKWNTSVRTINRIGNDLGLISARDVVLDKSAKVDFGDGDLKRVGHFNFSSGRGCGCDQGGITLLSDPYAASGGASNKSLQDLQTSYWHCDNADADLITAGGKTYIDAWSGALEDPGHPQRMLIGLKDGTFRPVCRIEQAVTVKPGDN